MKIIYITGRTGSGKTTLLNKIIDKKYIIYIWNTTEHIKSVCAESKEIGIDDAAPGAKLNELIDICANEWVEHLYITQE